MGEPVRIVAFAIGLALVLATAASVFTTLVIPRATSSRLLRSVSRILAGAVRPFLRRLDTYEAKDRVVALVGPFGLVALFGAWLLLLVIGFGLMIWWVSGENLTGSLGVSGSSIFTLGILSGTRGANKALDIIEAGAGFGVIALEIAYLPTLYAAFSAREAEVTMLAARGGVPAWGPEILARNVRFETVDELPGFYATWERWAAAVSESHTGYPSLIWFRSPDATARGCWHLSAVLDAAALHVALAPAAAPRQARLALRMGTKCLRSLADALHISYDPDPRPTDPIPAPPVGVRPGLRPPRGGALPDRDHPGGGLAPLRRLAGELRVDRRRPHPAGDATPGPVAAGAARDRRRPLPGHPQPDP